MKIFFYYTHKESLGHSIRTLSVVSGLKEIASVYVFNGGKEQSFLKIPSGIKYFNLPHPFYHRGNFQLNYSPILKKHILARINFIKSLAKKIKPDLFFTEFFPFGRKECAYELIPLINYFKKMGAKICASIGYPYIVSENSEVLKVVAPFYDKFFIHTPYKLELKYLLQDIKNPLLKKLYNFFFDKYKRKIIWTGYVLPKRVENNRETSSFRRSKKKKIRILVSRGGGVVYPKIIAFSILAKKYLPENYILEIIAGPSSTSKELKLFKNLAGKIKGVKLKRYEKNFSSCLKRADISVSMSGYNTSVQLMYFRKKAIVIPIIKTSGEKDPGTCLEQLARANILKDYLNTTVLDYHNLTPKNLARAIKQKVEEPFYSKVSKNWFKGVENTSKEVIKMFKTF